MEERVMVLELELGKINRKLLQIAWKIDDLGKENFKEPSEASEEPLDAAEGTLDAIENEAKAVEKRPGTVEAELFDLRGKLVIVESELSEIRARIGMINELMSANEISIDTLPDSNIVSHSLWKRMLAVIGHGFVGNVIVTLWIIATIMILFSGT